MIAEYVFEFQIWAKLFINKYILYEFYIISSNNMTQNYFGLLSNNMMLLYILSYQEEVVFVKRIV